MLKDIPCQRYSDATPEEKIIRTLEIKREAEAIVQLFKVRFEELNFKILLVPWLHILKHCYQQEFACKHTKILLVDILVLVFRPHFTVCNPLSNINI